MNCRRTHQQRTYAGASDAQLCRDSLCIFSDIEAEAQCMFEMLRTKQEEGASFTIQTQGMQLEGATTVLNIAARASWLA